MRVQEYRDHEDMMPIFEGEYNPPPDADAPCYEQERLAVYEDFLRSTRVFFGDDTLGAVDRPVELIPPGFSTSRKLGLIVSGDRWQTPQLMRWMREWVEGRQEDYMITVDLMSGDFGQVFMCVTREFIAFSGSTRAAAAFELNSCRA